jgi:hypothetical protein
VAGTSKSRHDFHRRPARSGGERASRVPEIVKPDRVEAGAPHRRRPHPPPEVRSTHRPPSGARNTKPSGPASAQRSSCPPSSSTRKGATRSSGARVRFGGPNASAPLRSIVQPLSRFGSANRHGGCVGQRVPPAQPAKRRQIDQGPVLSPTSVASSCTCTTDTTCISGERSLAAPLTVQGNDQRRRPQLPRP